MITEQELNKAMRDQNFIFYTFLSVLFFYVFVCISIFNNTKISMDPDAMSTLRTALYVVSLITLLITKLIKNFNLKKSLKGSLQAVSFMHPNSTMILTCALTQTIGIYGIILFILGQNPTDLYVLPALSAIAMLQYRPKKEELRGLLNNAQNPGAQN